MNDLSSQASLYSSAVQRPRVAVLVDGDNVPQNTLSTIEAKAQALGNPVIRRVYGDMALHKDWASETDYLTMHCTTSAGKNRADMHLVIGALDIAHRGLATHFLIMSDDRDFGPLVAHLREIKMQVEWAGKDKSASKQNTARPPKATRLEEKVVELIRSEGDAKSMVIVKLNGLMRSLHNTKISSEPEKNWRAYLSKRPELFICDPKGRDAKVKLVKG